MKKSTSDYSKSGKTITFSDGMEDPKLMSENAPSGWYKCKLVDYWVMQWVVAYYTKETREFYFGTSRLTQDKVKEVREYVMDVAGNPTNNTVHK